MSTNNESERQRVKIDLTQVYYDVIAAGLCRAFEERAWNQLVKKHNLPTSVARAMAGSIAKDIERMVLSRTHGEIETLLDRAL